MTQRFYGKEAKLDAGEIAKEVVLNRKSEGWSGEIEERDAVAEILHPFNIAYTDDMSGRWELRG